MNTPNKLSVSRIFMTIIIAILMAFNWESVGVTWPVYEFAGVSIALNSIIAGIIFILACITDTLDGYLARKNGEITDLGKTLDSIADKALVDISVIVLASKSYISPWIAIIFVFRDIVVDAIKIIAASKGKVVSAIFTGKVKAASQMIGIALAFFANLPFEIWNLRISDAFLYFAALMSMVSMIQYFNQNKELIFDK